MTYRRGEAGKVGIEPFHEPSGGRASASPIPANRGGEGFWTFEAVEERLVEAMQLWERSPGGGRWPFAGDGPWALITRRVRMAEGLKGMDVTRLLQEDDEAETRQWQGRDRPRPLTRDEIARRDEASDWLTLVPERDRELVILSLGALAGGEKRIPWLKMKSLLGVEFGAFGLQMRYRRAIQRIVKIKNGGFASVVGVKVRVSHAPK